jgi:class 3 adenylate cyclase
MPVESYSEADAQFPPTEAAPLESLFGTTPAPDREVRAVPEPDGTIATFMYARLHNFAAACQALSGAELNLFVSEVRRILSSSVQKMGGEIAKRRPDSLLCAFTHRPEDQVPNHARRGLHAAIMTVHEAMHFARKFGAEHPGLPPISMAVGVHLGPGEISPRSNSTGMVHAVGEAVEIARLLEVTATDLHWGVVTSGPTRQAAGPRIDAGRIGSVGLPDDSFLDVTEITGLVPRPGSTTPAEHYEALRRSLAYNQQVLTSANGVLANGAPAQWTGHLVVENYKLLRKIGEGGIATVFLAQPAGGGAAQVLKVLRLDSEEGVMALQRFMQEFALVAQIDHPNVARIFKQDFCAGHAYIAMEYFPQGDLRARMRRPLDPAIAMYYIKQIAAGLDAVHRVGIVHRDLKPDNIMLRTDGMVAITDFGIAKQTAMQITDTGANDIVGTPYYLSPEQVTGKPVDARCDLYSLGVLMFEMLTSTKPYRASTVEQLLQMHVKAPLPVLPPQHARLQPVLDKLMAKEPADRYESAAALLEGLKEVGA